MNKIIKNFKNLIRKIILNVNEKTNINFKINNLNKNFNNLINRTIFKVKDKTNDKFRISNFNKTFIVFIGFLFLYLFFLLTPLLYDKDWVQSKIESKIFKEFKINLSSSAEISYRILPAPHFLIKDSKILLYGNKSEKSIAEVKNFKVFIDQKNFLDKEKMSINKLIIDQANFFLLKNELKILNDSTNSQFHNKKIRVINSKVFFKDNFDEILMIVKINKATLFFDDEKLLNLFALKGNVFGTPFVLNLENKINSIVNKKINFEAKSIKLNILNESFNEPNKSIFGTNIISLLNSTIKTKYKSKEKMIIFTSNNSKIGISNVSYSGKLLTEPFDLDLEVNLGNYKISKLFSFNSILKEFIKSELLFNDNLNFAMSIIAETDTQNSIFQNTKINLNIVNGKMNIDNTIFVNNKVGLLELSDSNLLYRNNELVLNTDVLITVKDTKELFTILNTNKDSRKMIKNILINLEYNFLNNQITFNKIQIDNNNVNNQFLNIIENFNENNSNNLIQSRILINKLLNAYEG